MHLRNFPMTRDSYFCFRAVPTATLIKPEIVVAPSKTKIDLWEDRVARASAWRKKPPMKKSLVNYSPSTVSPHLLEFVTPPILTAHPRGSIPTTLFFMTSKARTHKHCVIRRKLRTKTKEAMNLIVTRGAKAKDPSSDTTELVFDDEEVRQRGDKWLLPGISLVPFQECWSDTPVDWAYICCPEAKIFSAPYSELIQAMRRSLERIWHAGMRLEETWAEAEKRKQADSSLPLARNPSYQLNADHYSLEKTKRTKGVSHKPPLLHRWHISCVTIYTRCFNCYHSQHNIKSWP